MRRSRWCLVLLVVGLLAAACGRTDDTSSESSGPTTTSGATSAGSTDCKNESPKATEVGVSADTITVTVMADVGSSLAPGLFQGNVDALNAYAKYVNANGGIACRQLVVRTWDSKLNADEAKNGQIDACVNSVAMVGGNALFNPDVKAMDECVDKSGKATGIPDVSALANDINEQCSPMSYIIQAVPETCPVVQGRPRPLRAFVGPFKWFQANVESDLHGVYLVPGDLPTTVQSAAYGIKIFGDAGIKWDATPKVSGRDEQSGYTPRVQAIKANNSNLVFNGSNDRAMINMRKEAKAQGVTSIKVWACSAACYTRNFLASGGPDVEGTYLNLQFLPFEEADTNRATKAYIDSVGLNKVDSFGFQAWQAAMLFKETIDRVVAKDGVNGVTRAAVLDTLKNFGNFDADGSMGAKDLRGISNCQIILQVKGGKFVRLFPAKPGTFECNDANVGQATLNPAAEAAKIK